MAGSHPHEIYSKDASVYLVEGDEKLATLREAVEQAGFIANLTARWQASGRPKEEFLVAIKANIMTASVYEPDSPVYTDPQMVEELMRLMRAEGFQRFVVVEAQNVYSYSYTGRRVPAVAEMCGYTGEGYEIADMTEDHVPFDYGGALGEHIVGRLWLEADYRISFAKNKTHWQCYYTACLKNIYGCLPAWDKMKHYHGKNIEFWQAAILIVDNLPVHFGFLDAWTSGDGFAGHVRDASPNPTHTIFASENIYAIDWVAGLKMQIDPRDNFVIQEAIRRWGTINVTPVGDMTPWHPWENVRPFVVSVLDFLEEYYWLSRFSSRALASDQDPRFPPVERYQWFFGITQKIVGFLERWTTVQTQHP